MTKHKGKVLIGTVVSAKMKDTVVVEVNRFVAHPKYEPLQGARCRQHQKGK